MSSSSLRKPKRISEREKEGFRHTHRKLGVKGRERSKGRMGNHKQKWTSVEEDALVAGVAKHGAGKWKNILIDPEFAQSLILRSNIDLKDKWRNLSPSLPLAQVTQKKRKNSKIKNSVRHSAPSLSLPSGTSPDAVMIDSNTEERYNALIFEALLTMKDPNGSDVGAIRDFIQQREEEPIPHNFKRLVGARLRSLVSLGKLEKTRNGFKIKDLGTKTPRGLATSTETEDDAVHVAAYTIADAENKSFLAAEAVKEAERVSKIAEEAESMLLLVKEINEQCSRGEVVHLA
ncbi:telomere repeat-binding factor 4 [Rosa sericea]